MNTSLSCTQNENIEPKNHETKNVSNSLVEKKEKVFRIKSSCSTGFPMESIFRNLVPAQSRKPTDQKAHPRPLETLLCVLPSGTPSLLLLLHWPLQCGCGCSDFRIAVALPRLTHWFIWVIQRRFDSTLSRFESYLTGRELQRSNNWIDRRDWAGVRARVIPGMPWAWPGLSLYVAMLIFIIVWLALWWNPFARQRVPATI